jgi:hypothetical protein
METSKLMSNPKNKYILSPAVRSYMQRMKSKFPHVNANLKLVRTMLANDLSCLC